MNLTLVINMMTAKALEILAMPEDEFNRRNEMEMAAEIDRLERDNDGLDKIIIDQARVITDLRARIAELEAAIAAAAALSYGTMGALQPDEPATITHGHAASAPPHDE